VAVVIGMVVLGFSDGVVPPAMFRSDLVELAVVCLPTVW